ncbi:hypothetical protein BKA91DRAFT_136731 [Yarrowia lipolytica]|nr:hypothetical protein BKA91DRAFT_136731 [Yarrowia lipolytica]KAE8173324.1 hypothetical protein BKA90DRAFT_135901 [Yarrowia lipolytica]RMI95747.1 hypothetical protein BD777DRAFT_129632 [Yarrowia lipolytica]
MAPNKVPEPRQIRGERYHCQHLSAPHLSDSEDLAAKLSRLRVALTFLLLFGGAPWRNYLTAKNILRVFFFLIVCSLSNMSAVVDLLAGSCYGTAVYTSVVSVSTGCQSIVTATK